MYNISAKQWKIYSRPHDVLLNLFHTRSAEVHYSDLIRCIRPRLLYDIILYDMLRNDLILLEKLLQYNTV